MTENNLLGCSSRLFPHWRCLIEYVQSSDEKETAILTPPPGMSAIL